MPGPPPRGSSAAAASLPLACPALERSRLACLLLFHNQLVCAGFFRIRVSDRIDRLAFDSLILLVLFIQGPLRFARRQPALSRWFQLGIFQLASHLLELLDAR